MRTYASEDTVFPELSNEQPSKNIRLIIIAPVYNDWASFRRLLQDLDDSLDDQCSGVTVIAVNDGSTLPAPKELGRSFRNIETVRILDLAVNLGHQRAIAVGLAFVNHLEADCVVIMDSDGEDKPSDVVALLNHFRAAPEYIHVVQRGRRSEPALFRTCYLGYRLFFRIATGLHLAHGNFCLLPMQSITAILHNSNTWNNLAASIVRSKLPYRTHRMDRGTRYEGKSKMNFTALVLHGLSAISVYLDVLSARLLIASSIALVGLFILVFTVIGIRLFTNLAIPGWATVTVGMLSIVMLQVIILAFNILLNLLHNRNQNLAVPAAVDRLYVLSDQTVYHANQRSTHSQKC